MATTKKEKCKVCGFRKRGKNHDNGDHHNNKVSKLKGRH